ncbi:formyl-CoA transferase [Antricoccus suffuscus]|uniref:Formyl-CoA transferase n=1 Tax=Antricoccus suffuscus TaxID=1629062 RepID=A0A2T1A1D4_9ACTN|nr:CoA transferase [Antricoccus suffuscus]PRZ42420.1 formyl-CoA transferase [Antricoccus suffuscus]
MAGPFAGITVVEFGQFVVVPFCSQLLADSGARVIKVEPLRGDAYRSGVGQLAPGFTRQFLIKNRGKESVSIDLAHPDAAPVIEELIKLADVVLINLSPSAVKRRGLDYERVAALNPRAIYGAATAYGQIGPEAPLPGMDVVVQARSGLMSSLAAENDGTPHHSEVQATDYASALLLYGGISAALYARTNTGKGQRVDVALLGGALALQNNSLAHHVAEDGWREDFVHETLPAMRRARATRAEVEAERISHRADPPGHTAHYRAFATKDGFLAVGAGSPNTRERLAALVGVDSVLATEQPATFGARLKEALLTRTNEEWIADLRAADIPVAPVRHIEEMLFDEHAIAEGLIAEYDHPVVGKFRGIGVPIRMSDTPMGGSPPTPSFAAHTASVLSEIGYTAAQISTLADSGAVHVAGDGVSSPNSNEE